MQLIIIHTILVITSVLHTYIIYIDFPVFLFNFIKCCLINIYIFLNQIKRSNFIKNLKNANITLKKNLYLNVLLNKWHKLYIYAYIYTHVHKIINL